jgi:hypothetical protein
VRREVVPLAGVVGLGPLRPLVVTDRYEDADGSMTGTLLGRWTLFQQTDATVVRSAAARTAPVFSPRAPLRGRGYAWRAEDDDHIVASTDNPPEYVEVHLRIASDGRLLSIVAQRWGEVTKRHLRLSPLRRGCARGTTLR